MSSSRREFLKFLGVSSVGISGFSLIQSCQNSVSSSPSPFPSRVDDVVLLEGLEYYPLISWGDKINNQHVFGFNNDYLETHYLSDDDLILWVNHEYTHPLFVSGWDRTKANIDTERSLTGGSLIRLKKQNGRWKFTPNDPLNKAIRSDTPMKFAYEVKIRGSNDVEGTCSNCAGGKTPWGTFLSCEENYDMNYGEWDRKKQQYSKQPELEWNKFYPNPPEHYGWVVEIDPLSGQAFKHTTLGRFAHESATCSLSKSGKVIVYSGDDKADEHIYKFVSHSSDSFKEGILYVANIEMGRWLPLDIELSPKLKSHFKNQLEVLTFAREASKILGATKLNRPEDIEIHPFTGEIFVSLTNNKKKGDFHGSILKISEDDQDHGSLTFSSEIFSLGGEKFSCPDNLAFDTAGNLWFASDMSGSAIGEEPYKKFGNNGLFVIPTQGDYSGKVIQVASAPSDAEFTGIKFDKDGSTLFLSVQHPGETSKSLNQLTSHWPTGNLPKPTVIAITGKTLGTIKQMSS
ncbi:MAG: alkaline phosphatase [Halobacteriovoraceae bacterium]|nr:alkaline phosphatase [Halobacteriovoraceae bacterium]|tara:strand:- start:5578 stop:7125 length:1548 start_codon:yes stop_codon:yes gene_type:complete